MKRITVILIALLMLLSLGQLWAQRDRSTLPYKPAVEFKGDTVQYLEYNYTMRSVQYAGKTVGEILDELEYPVETVEEYKVFYDNLVSRLQVVEKDTSSCTGKSLSEFVKLLEKNGLETIQIGVTNYDRQKVYPQHVYGVRITFTTDEISGFASDHELMKPVVHVNFEESMPYEKAISLSRKYKGYLSEEVEAFYSGAIIKTIGFYFMDSMYRLDYTGQ